MSRELHWWTSPGGVRLSLVQGDITAEAVDAIVNAANSHLQHGGGLAAQIVRVGGSAIQRESDGIAYVPVGHAAITGAGALPCRFVIHAVGPRWGEGDEDRKLGSALASSLALADEHGLRRIAVPAISSGIFGFPKDRCARVLLRSAVQYLADHPASALAQIRFCLYDTATTQAFEVAWLAVLGAAGRLEADV